MNLSDRIKKFIKHVYLPYKITDDFPDKGYQIRVNNSMMWVHITDNDIHMRNIIKDFLT